LTTEIGGGSGGGTHDSKKKEKEEEGEWEAYGETFKKSVETFFLSVLLG
jgi:hypothetical protein